MNFFTTEIAREIPKNSQKFTRARFHSRRRMNLTAMNFHEFLVTPSHFFSEFFQDLSSMNFFVRPATDQTLRRPLSPSLMMTMLQLESPRNDAIFYSAAHCQSLTQGR